MEQSGQKIITAHHSMACGDLISIMAGMKAVYDRTGAKWRILQTIGLPSMYYEGCVYSTHSETGVPVTMNEHLFRMIRPLVEAQEYIESLRIYNHEPVDIDFDKMFTFGKCNKPWGMIQRWPFYAFHELALDCDLSKPWLTLPDSLLSSQINDEIIVNRTARYNHNIDYTFLAQYHDRYHFIGTNIEFNKFRSDFKVPIPHLVIMDFLQAAQVIERCKLFVGNQSLMWNIAEALKVPRVLEIFPPAPNCIPVGKDGYDAMWQAGMEYYVKELFNR